MLKQLFYYLNNLSCIMKGHEDVLDYSVKYVIRLKCLNCLRTTNGVCVKDV